MHSVFVFVHFYPVLAIPSVGWMIFRGDLHSEAWIRALIGVLSGPQHS